MTLSCEIRHDARPFFGPVAPMKLTASFLAGLTALCMSSLAFAADEMPSWMPQLLGAQATGILQHLSSFNADYSGPMSLDAKGGEGFTHTYGVYFGSAILPTLQLYADAEMARGRGVSNATGLGGITNGDVIRQGTANLGEGPYLARAFLRYLIPLSNDTVDRERAMDQLPVAEPAERIEIKAGLMAVSDDFDLNRYANSTRTQFLNWGLFNNTAWDFAANTRGYSRGVNIAYVTPLWALRIGSYQMPTQANGNSFDPELSHARGDNIELTLSPNQAGTVLRLLAYENHARMGNYRDAIAAAQGAGHPPDIVADDQPGRRKRGWGANLEQPLGDNGDTGVFMRVGGNDGHTEDFAFTEVDQHFSVGGQLNGRFWSRNQDHLAFAYLRHGLSKDHRDYLAAGGRGFLLGDGGLNYGHEQIAEVYYLVQVCTYAQLSPDYQYVVNPGYNRDRGPARVMSLRLRVSY